LELEYKEDGDGVLLHQLKYATNELVKYDMWDAKPTKTPADVNMKVYPNEGKELDEQAEYKTIIGSLIYLTFTRPDVAFIVWVLSRYMHKPRKPHMYAARRVLRYIKGTIGYGVEFKREQNAKLIRFCDADYAGDPSNRRSATGYVFLVGSSAVSWSSKRQPTVSLLTTEAEYRASANAAQELVWLVRLMKDLNQEITLYNKRQRMWIVASMTFSTSMLACLFSLLKE
jgi:hypothetical protein